MSNIKVRYEVNDALLLAADSYESEAAKHYATLRAHQLEYTGWVDYAEGLDAAFIRSVTDIADEIKANSDALVVIGIGGSYLGARAAYDFIRVPKERIGVDLLFAGYNLSADYHNSLIEKLEGIDFSIVQISKSGGTVEPAMAFLAFRELLVSRYGEAEAASRTYAVTDAKNGVLREEIGGRGYKSLVIPGDIGGRYSVLTPVGLLPMAVAGVDIAAVLAGARTAASDENTAACLRLASVRHAVQNSGKTVEVVGCFEPAVDSFIQWILQLYGESEGKDGKGMLPTGVSFSRDLHSLGQFFQQGNQIFMETLIDIVCPDNDLAIAGGANGAGQPEKENLFAGRGMNEFNHAVRDGMIRAHRSVGIPIALVEALDRSENTFGQLVYFFELTCGVTGLLMGVDPFNQPGVEDYKKEMMAILRG